MRTIFRVIIIIFLIILLIITSILIKYYSFFSWSKEKQAKIEELAIKNNDPSLCEKLPVSIPDIEPRSECYFRVALGTKNPELCRKTRLGGYCYGQIAIRYKDISMCSYAPSNDAHTCYINAAPEVGGTDTCDKIQDINYKVKCYTVIKNQTLELCNQVGIEVIRNQCYYGLALRENNQTICDKIINDNADKESCVTRTS